MNSLVQQLEAPQTSFQQKELLIDIFENIEHEELGNCNYLCIMIQMSYNNSTARDILFGRAEFDAVVRILQTGLDRYNQIVSQTNNITDKLQDVWCQMAGCGPQEGLSLSAALAAALPQEGAPEEGHPEPISEDEDDEPFENGEPLF